jgi:DNA polymerase-1
VRAFQPNDIINIDYETTGFLSDRNARIFAASFTWCNDEDGYTEVVRGADLINRLQLFWKSPCTAVTHNLMFEYGMTRRHGFAICTDKILHDTMIMHQYLDNLSPRHSLDYVSTRYAGHVQAWDDADASVKKAVAIYGSYDKVPEQIMHDYQLADGERGALLYNTLFPLLQRNEKMLAGYYQEISAVKVLTEMSERGIMVDVPAAKRMQEELTAKVVDAEARVHSMAGFQLNVLSPVKLRTFLEDDWGVDVGPKIDNAAIEVLREQCDNKVRDLLDCVQLVRSYRKGIAMIDGYINAAKHDGKVHPNIKSNHADTGRMASENPNMQNVPKEIKAGARYPVAARKCFRPSPKHFLLLVDYAGIEMRLGVQGTKSERLIELCRKGFDFHDATARSFYGTLYTDRDIAVSKYLEMYPATRKEYLHLCETTSREEAKDVFYVKAKKPLRNRAKNGRFSMFYGAGVDKISKTLGLSLEETKIGYDRDMQDFPEFYEFMGECSSFARRKGYIETFFGRRLRVNPTEPYIATDYKIQGSAAELFKRGLVNVYWWLKSWYGLENVMPILPVHDELIFEVRRDLLGDLPELCAGIKEQLIHFDEITVPLDVEFSTALYNWADKKEIK